MKSESRRLASFAGWSVPFIRPADLAKAGFYSVNQRDNCRFLVYIVFWESCCNVFVSQRILYNTSHFKCNLCKHIFHLNHSINTNIPNSRCAFCDNFVGDWEEGDVPMEEHAKLFPLCGFVRGLPVGNIPIEGKGQLYKKIETYIIATGIKVLYSEG